MIKINLKRITTLALVLSLLVVGGCASKMGKSFQSYQAENFPVAHLE